MSSELAALLIMCGITGGMLFLGLFVGWDWAKYTHVHYRSHVGGSGGSSARRQRKKGGYGPGSGGGNDNLGYDRLVGG